MQIFNICDYFGFIFVAWCAKNSQVQLPVESGLRTIDASSSNIVRISNTFELEYQWTYINYTWPSQSEYQNSLASKRYIPENNAMSGIKIYNDRIYMALPRLRAGTPVTLAYIPASSAKKTNVLLTPFPSWGMNAQASCSSLQNVQSMEIDRNGVMWVIDGIRFNKFTTCPPKLVLLDLNNRGKVLQTYNFPNEICLHNGGFLNDIVIDSSSVNEDEYAYITDNSGQDPGLIVFSRRRNTAWKLRDRTMFADVESANFTVDNVPNVNLVPIDGIALSPVQKYPSDDRVVYYCALSSHALYALSTRVLQNEPFTKTDYWRRYIRFVGRKQAQSDGMVLDNKGNLYYGLLPDDAIGKWNIFDGFETAREIDRKPGVMIWPDSFAMDNAGFLYVLANGINKYFAPTFPLSITTDPKFRIFKLYTGTKSYLYQ